MTSGHQRYDGPSRRSGYFDYRKQKLKTQAEDQFAHDNSSTILKGTSVYIGGYLAKNIRFLSLTVILKQDKVEVKQSPWKG